MKILYHHRIGSKDGQYVHIQELTEALAQAGHEIVMVGPSGFAAQSFGGAPGIVVRLKRWLPAAVYELAELGYNMIDIVRLARALVRERPDVIYERYNLFLLSGVVARWFFRTPILLEVNAPLYEERAAFGGLGLPWLGRACERLIWRSMDHVFCVTRVLADIVVATGVTAERISVTPNGIDLAAFCGHPDSLANGQVAAQPERCTLGFVGFVREWHGLDAVVDFLAKPRQGMQLHLVLVGDGPARAALQAQAQRLGVADRLTVTGVVERDAIPAHVRGFDIALQPHVTSYASPLKLFEYMACETAIIAPDTANVREILTHEHDALLIDTAAPNALIRAIERLLDDPAMGERLARAARCTIDDRQLTWTHNAERVAEVACGLIQEAK